MDTVTVEFAPNALNAIKADVIHGFKSIPRRGAEVGGILCGAIVDSGPISLVRVESVIPVPVEHRFGPTYRFSEGDKLNFRKATQDWAPLGVIGWYRSQTRPEEAPGEEDRALSAEFFPKGRTAFLICYPDATLNVPGKFCIWTAGQQEESTHIELGRYSLLEEALQAAAEEKAEPEEHVEAPPEPPRKPEARMPEVRVPEVRRLAVRMPEPLVEVRLPESRIPETRVPETRIVPPIPEFRPVTHAPLPTPQAAMAGATPRNGKIALVSTLTAAVLCGAYLVNARLKPSLDRSTQLRPAGLGMKVDRQGGELMVSWNRQAPEIVQASEANFKIMENGRGRTITLSPHELRTGSLLYTATADDIEMELDVSGPVGDFAESVRVVGGAPGATVIATPVEPTRTAVPRAASPSAAKVRTVEAPPATVERAETPARKPVRAFVAPPAGKTERERMAAALPEAPNLQAALHSDAAIPVALPVLPAPRPINTPNTPQSTPQNTPKNSAAPPLISAGDYTPPRATRSVQPSMAASSTIMDRAFAQSNKPHEVQVEVSIDEHGAVASANVATTTGPFAYLFVDSALAAARSWQFEPAKRSGRPVASRMTLKFQFVKP